MAPYACIALARNQPGPSTKYRACESKRSSSNAKWGPALLPAPICAERRIRRCSSAFETRRFPAPRSWLTSSGVASGRRSQSEDGFYFLLRPFLDQSPFASPVSRGTPRSRKKDWLFRRLFRLVQFEAEASPHRLPVEIGPSVPSSSFLSLPTIRGGWDFRPDHPFLMNLPPSRSKGILHLQACG